VYAKRVMFLIFQIQNIRNICCRENLTHNIDYGDYFYKGDVITVYSNPATSVSILPASFMTGIP